MTAALKKRRFPNRRGDSEIALPLIPMLIEPLQLRSYWRRLERGDC